MVMRAAISNLVVYVYDATNQARLCGKSVHYRELVVIVTMYFVPFTGSPGFFP